MNRVATRDKPLLTDCPYIFSCKATTSVSNSVLTSESLEQSHSSTVSLEKCIRKVYDIIKKPI